MVPQPRAHARLEHRHDRLAFPKLLMGMSNAQHHCIQYRPSQYAGMTMKTAPCLQDCGVSRFARRRHVSVPPFPDRHVQHSGANNPSPPSSLPNFSLRIIVGSRTTVRKSKNHLPVALKSASVEVIGPPLKNDERVTCAFSSPP